MRNKTAERKQYNGARGHSLAEKIVNNSILRDRRRQYDALEQYCNSDPIRMFDVAGASYKYAPSTDNYAILKACMLALQQKDIQAGYTEL